MPSRGTRIVKRLWIWITILAVLVWVYPIENRLTRLAEIVGLLLVVGGALGIWWNTRVVRWTLISIITLFIAVISLPSRQVQPDKLSIAYANALKRFEGVRYIWGGESFLGIDCSGLMRKGFFWAEVVNGFKAFNGALIRDAISLWWHDCTANDLRNGYNGRTQAISLAPNLINADYSKLQQGDMAVVGNGVHVMAYLGNQTWIEADPDLHRVVTVTIPTDNPWFNTPAVVVRWNQLSEVGSTNNPKQ